MKFKFRLQHTPRQLRQLNVKELTQELKQAKSLVLFESTKVTHQQFEELRRKLREKKAVLRFVKNTLFAVAARELGLPTELYSSEIIYGPTAVIYILTDDFVSAVKAFAEVLGGLETVRVKIAFLDKTIYKGSDVLEFAKIPTEEELQAKLVGMLQAPLYSLHRVLDALPRGLANLIQQLAERR